MAIKAYPVNTKSILQWELNPIQHIPKAYPSHTKAFPSPIKSVLQWKWMIWSLIRQAYANVQAERRAERRQARYKKIIRPQIKTFLCNKSSIVSKKVTICATLNKSCKNEHTQYPRPQASLYFRILGHIWILLKIDRIAHNKVFSLGYYRQEEQEWGVDSVKWGI